MNQSFDVQGPVELDIRLASGDIEIDPTLDGRVEVELIAHDEDSQHLVDAARVELQDRGPRPTLLIDVPNKRGGGFNFGMMFGRSGISCRVRCPQESGVQVRSKSTDLLVRGTIGGLNVTTASGDVEVENVSGGVSVKSASGDFSGRRLNAVNIQTASGDISIESAHGPLNLTSVSGDISIEEAYDNVFSNSVSGDQSHLAVMQGKVAVNSVSGDVSVAVRRGSKVYLDCNTVSGDTHSELEVSGDAPTGDGPMVEIRAKTVSGDIHITRAPAPTNTEEVHA